MDISISEKGAFASALVKLAPGEQFVSESGAMFRASDNVAFDVTTKARGQGGILGGMKRLLAAENFFFSTYTCNGPNMGEVGIAPTLPGDIAIIECDGTRKWLCTGGSYLASSPELAINTQFQGLKGLFTGESISFVEVSGVGKLLVSGFGHVIRLQVSGGLIVDTGHVVAFEDSLSYTPTKAGSSWIQSFLASEGVVLQFSGNGALYVQSHNPSGFGKSLGPSLPPK
jgi:uncharacterized protein (TIGR00266 family)